jgi:hypothetical protein
LACILTLELLCRMLPVSTTTATGYYFDDKILTYPAYHEWKTATGWDLRKVQRLRSNNFGFVAKHDFVRDSDAIAVIGDSFVEASMLDAVDRLDAQLERALLPRRAVFAMGGPGSCLLDYAERIRWAHEHFGIQDFVVLMERGDVRQSLCGSGNNHGPCLDARTLAPRTELQPPSGTVKRIARHSALAQYLFSQLKITPEATLRRWLSALSHALPITHSAASQEAVVVGPGDAARVVDAVAQAFFERIRPHAIGRLVIVMDSDRAGIEAGRSTPDAERARFIALARAAGAAVIDTEPLFRAHAAASTLRLEVGPADAHLNALGLGIVARAASAVLAGDAVQQ